jgi:hypothetical protein
VSVFDWKSPAAVLALGFLASAAQGHICGDQGTDNRPNHCEVKQGDIWVHQMSSCAVLEPGKCQYTHCAGSTLVIQDPQCCCLESTDCPGAFYVGTCVGSAQAVVAIPSAMAGASSPRAEEPSCGFEKAALSFAGPPLEQARCLLRHVRPGGDLDPPLAALPRPFDLLIARPVDVGRASLLRYLAAKKISEAEIGGALSEPVSHANDGDPRAPLARYFVIHDTSDPNLCAAAAFPGDLDLPSAPWNQPERYKGSDQAHLYILRDGRSVAPQGRSFKIPWRAVKSELPFADVRAKGLFLHIENVQPRRCAPDTRQPAGKHPDRQAFIWSAKQGKWICRNDRIAPSPGLSDAQLDRLALVYVAASLRRGEWLVPAFHAAIDAGLPDAHDDPQNFDLAHWGERLCLLLRDLGKPCSEKPPAGVANQ